MLVYLSVHTWTLSSAGERFLHTEEVTGSIPVVSTRYAVLAQLAEQLICNHQVVGSIPIDGTKLFKTEGHVPSFKIHAPMAELADALDLGSSEATRTGSIPATRTKNVKLRQYNILNEY